MRSDCTFFRFLLPRPPVGSIPKRVIESKSADEVRRLHEKDKFGFANTKCGLRLAAHEAPLRSLVPALRPRRRQGRVVVPLPALQSRQKRLQHRSHRHARAGLGHLVSSPRNAADFHSGFPVRSHRLKPAPCTSLLLSYRRLRRRTQRLLGKSPPRRPLPLLEAWLSIEFRCGPQRQRLDRLLAVSSFQRHLFRRNQLQWPLLQRRTAWFRRSGSQLRLPPPHLLALDERLFLGFPRQPQYLRGLDLRHAFRPHLSQRHLVVPSETVHPPPHPRICNRERFHPLTMDPFRYLSRWFPNRSQC